MCPKPLYFVQFLLTSSLLFILGLPLPAQPPAAQADPVIERIVGAAMARGGAMAFLGSCQRLAAFYARFSARLNDPRSFWIFSCSRVMA